MPEPLTLLFLVLAAFLAGFIDACVGGGGLITIPALLIGMPGHAITTVLGTNKVVAATGTTLAAAQFVRSRAMSVREMVGPVVAGGAGAACGVALAYFLQGRFEGHLRPLMIFLMAGMLLFTVLKPQLGTDHAPRFALHHQRALATGIAFAIGFYDGFFGPGTGSMLIFLFVVVLGFDFLRASALSKSVNWASNIVSLGIFVARGSWVPVVAGAMAVGNGLGGYLGARMALAKGSAWIRVLFIVVVSALILKLGYDQWLK